MPDGHVRMSVSNQLRAIDNGFRIVASFPELKGIPIVIGESDPEGCAACPVATDPHNAYRNGTMYSSYTAEQLARTYQLQDLHGVNLLGSVTWAFEFEDQPWFYGFRDLATNGVDKPVLNVFRMLGKMEGVRLAVESSGALPLEQVRDESVRGQPDIAALATRSDSTVAVLVWNYHDDDLPAPAAVITLTLENLPEGRPVVTLWRIDEDNNNAYARWLEMGSPQPPTPAQHRELEEVGRLLPVADPSPLDVKEGNVVLSFTLPRQGVLLITLTRLDEVYPS